MIPFSVKKFFSNLFKILHEKTFQKVPGEASLIVFFSDKQSKDYFPIFSYFKDLSTAWVRLKNFDILCFFFIFFYFVEEQEDVDLPCNPGHGGLLHQVPPGCTLGGGGGRGRTRY